MKIVVILLTFVFITSCVDGKKRGRAAEEDDGGGGGIIIIDGIKVDDKLPNPLALTLGQWKIASDICQAFAVKRSQIGASFGTIEEGKDRLHYDVTIQDCVSEKSEDKDLPMIVNVNVYKSETANSVIDNNAVLTHIPSDSSVEMANFCTDINLCRMGNDALCEKLTANGDPYTIKNQAEDSLSPITKIYQYSVKDTDDSWKKNLRIVEAERASRSSVEAKVVRVYDYEVLVISNTSPAIRGITSKRYIEEGCGESAIKTYEASISLIKDN